MHCPRCKNINKQEDATCSNCGLKLQVPCPRCKALNKIGKEKCSSCNLTLLVLCPQCKARNLPSSQNCRKCGTQISKKCSLCNAIYPAKYPKCPKCQKTTPDKKLKKEPLEKKPAVKSQSPVKAEAKEDIKYAVLSCELFNLSAIRAKISNKEIIARILNKFYQINAKNAKEHSQSAIKIDEHVMAIEFKNTDSIQESAEFALNTAQNILCDINELNHKLSKSIKTKLKLKIGIAIKSKGQKYFAQTERSAAKSDEIIINEKLSGFAKNDFALEKVTLKNDPSLVLYKLKEEGSKEPETSYQQIQKNSTESEKINREASSGKTVTSFHQRQEVFNFIKNSVTQSDECKLISVSAPAGYGKTSLVMSLRQELSSQNIIWMSGQCFLVNQSLPMAFLQELFKNLFNLPCANVNTEESKKLIEQILQEKIGITEEFVKNTIYTLLFAQNSEQSSDIFTNKGNIIEALATVIERLSNQANIVLLIEDIDFIDVSSLECITALINKGMLRKNIQIIATSNSNRPINSFFYTPELNEKNTVSFNLGPLRPEEMSGLIDSFINNSQKAPEELKNKLAAKSKGSPLYLTEALFLLFQINLIYFDNNQLIIRPEISSFELPDTLDELVSLRLNAIGKISQDAIRIAVFASALGPKFMPAFIKVLSGLNDDQFNAMMQEFVSNGIFIGLDNYNFMFKHEYIWELIFKKGLPEEKKQDAHIGILNILKENTNSFGATLAFHSEAAKLPEESIEYWQQSAREAKLLGDPYAHILSLQRTLKWIEESEIKDKEALKIKIWEEIGKACYQFNPQEAIKYLSNALVENEKQGNTVKMIELAGYLCKSCELAGNFSGAIECVNKSLDAIQKEKQPLEYALLNFSKLELLYNTGKLEEGIILAKNEVIPIVTKAVEESRTIEGLNENDILRVKLESEIIFSKLLALQGNPKALDVAQFVCSQATQYNYQDLVVKANLSIALFNTLQGDTKGVYEIINSLQEIIPQVKSLNGIDVDYSFIVLLNMILTKSSESLENQFNQVLRLSDANGSYVIQTLTKALICNIYRENKDYEKASQGLNETIQFCSENKLATGALLTWSVISKLEAEKGNIDSAISIAQNALDIAKKPDINHIFFIAAIQNLLAELYTAKGDFESAKMYIEQGVALCEKSKLHILSAQLYLTFGKLFHECANVLDNNKGQYAQNAHKAYTKALQITEQLENQYFSSLIQKEIENLKTLCQLSGISI